MSAKCSAFRYNQSMKIELAYKISDKKDQLIAFSSSLATDENALRSFLIDMFEKSPKYTDRTHSHNSDKHEVDFESILETVNFAIRTYGSEDLIIFFEYKNSTMSLQINVLDNSHTRMETLTMKPRIYNIPGNYLKFVNRYVFIAEISYQSVFDPFDEDTLTKCGKAVALCLAKSNAPLSRSDVSKMLFISDRSITNAFNELNKKGLVRNLNKTNSSKMNKYVLLRRS